MVSFPMLYKWATYCCVYTQKYQSILKWNKVLCILTQTRCFRKLKTPKSPASLYSCTPSPPSSFISQSFVFTFLVFSHFPVDHIYIFDQWEDIGKTETESKKSVRNFYYNLLFKLNQVWLLITTSNHFGKLPKQKQYTHQSYMLYTYDIIFKCW